MTGLLDNKRQFMIEHFPEMKGRIALVDVSQNFPVPSEKLRDKFCIYNSTSPEMAAIHSHVHRQLRYQLDGMQDIKHYLAKMFTSNLSNMKTGKDLEAKRPFFADVSYTDFDWNFKTSDYFRAGYIAYDSTASIPLVNSGSGTLAKIYPVPEISERTSQDIVFLHEFFHAAYRIYGPLYSPIVYLPNDWPKEGPLPGDFKGYSSDVYKEVDKHHGELAADVFSILVTASNKYPDWMEAARYLADMRLINGFNHDPKHLTTPAINAAIQYAQTPSGRFLSPAKAYKVAIEIAKAHPVFTCEQDFITAEKIGDNLELSPLQKEVAFLGTAMQDLAPAYETLKIKLMSQFILAPEKTLQSGKKTVFLKHASMSN